MKIGLTGLTGSGKTTIFNALTGSQLPVGAFTDADAEPIQAVINVPDERVDELVNLYQPQKTAYATLELQDFSGLSNLTKASAALMSNTIRQMKNLDALGLVLKNFSDDLSGDPTPVSDLDQIYSELLISDLMIVENRLERIEWGYKRGQKSPEIQNEERVLRRIHQQLDRNEPISAMDLSDIELRIIRGFQFLTQKSTLIILNSGEKNFNRNSAIMQKLEARYPLVEFAGKFEMELIQIEDSDEMKLFMTDIGISDSARDRLARNAYEILGYISFFTVGTDEVRAWNILHSSNAVTAAAAIHTDLARGFIRAECFTYSDLMTAGDETTVKKNGKFRLEGKDYIVKDGDILGIRFNV